MLWLVSEKKRITGRMSGRKIPRIGGHLRCKSGCDQIYFDEINLMELLHKKRDKQVTGLIKKRLKAGVVGQGVITRTGEDSPQEDPQSLLLEKI